MSEIYNFWKWEIKYFKHYYYHYYYLIYENKMLK